MSLGSFVVRTFKASEKLSEHFIHQTLKGKQFHQCAVTEAATFISVILRHYGLTTR